MRVGVDLSKRPLGDGSREKRARMLAELGEFLRTRYGISVDELCEKEGRVVSRHLVDFGQFLFEDGRSLGDYILSILAVADLERTLRRHLQPAWDLASTWQALTPAENHVPTPPVCLLAMVSLCLCWNWRSMAAYLLLSFTGLLRPGETLGLRRCDILLPADMMSTRRCMYIIVRRPKMRRIAARREHVRVSDPVVLAVMEHWLQGASSNERLFPISSTYLRVLHDHLVRWLGISCLDGTGLTPASHRAGGATLMFRECNSIEYVRWHGRWACTSRTLEVYVQEVAALTVLPNLSADSRARIALMAHASMSLLQEAISP